MTDEGRLRVGEGERPRAVVVAVQLHGIDDAEQEASIVELERLAKTLGLEPVGRVVQRRASLAPGVVLGEGKLKELAAWTGGTGVVPAYEKPGKKRAPSPDEAVAEGEPAAPKATLVLVDHDLTPTQHSNL